MTDRQLWVSVAMLGCLACPASPTVDHSRPLGPIPVETSDAESLRIMTDWRALPSFGAGRYKQFSSHDRGVESAAGLFANENRDVNYFVCRGNQSTQESPLLPYVYELNRCPEPYVRGSVLARATGSGRLARLWISSLGAYQTLPETEILRIYADGYEQPVVEVPLGKAFTGEAGEIFAPPFGMAASQHLSWYYPVVFSNLLVVSLDHLSLLNLYYYHADVVLDDKPKERVVPHERLAARDGAKATLQALADGPAARVTAHLLEENRELTPAASWTLSLQGPATVQAMEVRLPAQAVSSLDEVELQVYWDGEAAPAMKAPLGWLLASSLERPSQPSLALTSELDGPGRVVLKLRLPMPFAREARWIFTNRGSTPLALDVLLAGERVVPAQPWGHLRAQVNETTAPFSGKTHPVARATGSGRLAGACFSLEGHPLPPEVAFSHPLNFLEGDETIVVDGVPAILGTGTEEIGNSAFYFVDGPFGNAFAQQWVRHADAGSPSRGQVSFCRWYVLTGALDFHSSLTFDLEVGPGTPELLDRYRTVSFVYQ